MPCAEEIPAVRGQTPITRSIKITVTSCCYGQQTARWLMKTNCSSDGHCEISLQDRLSYLSPRRHMKGSGVSLSDGSDVRAPFSRSRCLFSCFLQQLVQVYVPQVSNRPLLFENHVNTFKTAITCNKICYWCVENMQKGNKLTISAILFILLRSEFVYKKNCPWLL